LFGCLGSGAAYVLHSENRRQKVGRSVNFWRRALPIYCRYRWEEYRIKDLTEAEQDAALNALHDIYSKRIIGDILALRGLYIKLGQIMTSRPDYAPPQYQESLKVLEDHVPARPFRQIRADVERDMGLGSLDEVFASVEEEPLGAATIGQVHGANLLDGRRVVIKYQYPEVERLFTQDLETVQTFCRLLQPEFSPMLEEMSRQFKTEFDFVREAWGLQTIGDAVRGAFPGITIPRPVPELCSRRVCVMERVDGVKLVDGMKAFYEARAAEEGITIEELRDRMAARGDGSAPATASQMELYRGYLYARAAAWNALAVAYNNTAGLLLSHLPYETAVAPMNHVRIVDELLDVHGFQIFELGVFNGDCHPGNILVDPDGSLILIDYGQVKSLLPKERYDLARMVLAVCSDDPARIVSEWSRLGFKTKNNDPWVIERTARLFFEDDTNVQLRQRKDGTVMNIQQSLEYLQEIDPTESFPEFSFMAIRVAMLLRGLASHLGLSRNVAHAWKPHAEKAVAELSHLDNTRHRNGHEL